MAAPSPEAMIQERFKVSIVELIVEAQAMRRGASQAGTSVETWRQVCGWLESKLPPGVTVDDLGDPMLSPQANARYRAEAAASSTGTEPPVG